MASAKRAVAVGDVFAVSLGGGRHGLCRVIALENPRGTWDREGRYRVVTCEWVGPRSKLAAALRSPAAMAPLVLTRLRGTPHVQSIGGPPPARFAKVGSVPPSPAERKLRSPRNPGAWEWVASQVAAETKFRADPERVRALETSAARTRARERAREVAEARAAAKARQPSGAFDARALARLARTRDLAHWRHEHPADFVREVRSCLRELAVSLAPEMRVASVKAAIRRAIRHLNRLDARWDNPIQTPDAEELVELLVNIGVSAGLDDETAADVVDETRDF